LIAFTPVTPGTSRGAHVRCDWSTGGIQMTYTGCIGCAGLRIWLHFYM